VAKDTVASSVFLGTCLDVNSLRILVTGATGYVGSRLVAALLAAEDGHKVIAATRNPERLGDFGWCDQVDAVALDADDPESAAAVFATAGPVDLVYYLVHGIGNPGFRERDNTAAANVARAAAHAGVKRIVYRGGFVPDVDAADGAADTLSEHLAGRAEVAHALSVDGGAEVVWLGAAVIIGAGSTSFEMVRYVGDRLPLIPMPPWVDHPIDPISIRDCLHYLLAAADPEQVPAGSYDIVGPDTTTYRGLLRSYGKASHSPRLGLPISERHNALLPKALVSWVAGTVIPVPTGLAVDLIESLDHPMTASGALLGDVVAPPPGGLTSVDDAVAAAVSSRRPLPVDQLTDPHHLADTDAQWAGGDALRIRQFAKTLTPTFAWPALGLLAAVPKPVEAWVRTGVDLAVGLVPGADLT
jgi:uncharacterized protein YbjT (DUF2867 family)